jgi:hemerythrin
VFSTGALIGENYSDENQLTNATYRTISFVHALKIPALAFYRFIEEHYLFSSLQHLFGRKQFLLHTWLFGEALSPKVQTSIAENLHPIEFPESGEVIEQIEDDSLYLIERGAVARKRNGRTVEQLEAGDFFGEDRAVFAEDLGTQLEVSAPVTGYRLKAETIEAIPIIRWKLLETHQRRKRILRNN